MTLVNATCETAKFAQLAAKPHDDFMPLKSIIERHAEFAFRHQTATEREESVSEAVASAFRSFVRLKARGQNPTRDFPGSMATYGVLYVQDGRHTSTKDVLSRRAQRKHGFSVDSLTPFNPRCKELSPAGNGNPCLSDVVAEQLYENSRTPPGEQAAFRIDYEAWLTGLNHRDRQLILDLAAGERATDLARKYGISLGRVSQKRRQFQDSWQRFQGEQLGEADADVA